MFVYARAATPQTGETIVRSVRERLRAADPNLPVTFVKSFRAQHEGSPQVWVLRAAAKMFLTLGLAGTFVAVIGLYGVRSYLVSRRTREFGVRLAIGASPADVLSLVVRESLAITIVGLTIGLASPCCSAGACGSRSIRSARSIGRSGSRDRDSRDRVARGVNHSGSTGC